MSMLLKKHVFKHSPQFSSTSEKRPIKLTSMLMRLNKVTLPGSIAWGELNHGTKKTDT